MAMTATERFGALVDRSVDCEATSYPWWAILNPSQNMAASVHGLQSQIMGVFLSRESAELFLARHRYRFNERAGVFCFSGNDSAWQALILETRERMENRMAKESSDGGE